MDFIITFFRDILDGPLYTGIVIVNSILICSCIGYLGEQYLNKKKLAKEYAVTHVAVDSDNPTAGASSEQQVSSNASQSSSETQENSDTQSLNSGQ